MEDAYGIIRKQVTDEMLDTITSKVDAIRTLLDNGRPLLEITEGERFVKMWNKRQMLWHKLHTLNEVLDMVFDMRK